MPETDFAVLVTKFKRAAIELNKYHPRQNAYADKVAESEKLSALRWEAITAINREARTARGEA
jgi:hypothetical protein